MVIQLKLIGRADPADIATLLPALTEAATRVDVGYFTTGPMTTDSASGGTAASAVGILLEQGYAWRNGALQPVRTAQKVRAFTLDGQRRSGISLAGSEHLALPRIAPQLDEVSVSISHERHLAAAVAVSHRRHD